MAKKKTTSKDVVSATLEGGTKVTASKEVIEKLTRGAQKAPRRATSATSAKSDSE